LARAAMIARPTNGEDRMPAPIRRKFWGLIEDFFHGLARLLGKFP
jgi:hypothetical protein